MIFPYKMVLWLQILPDIHYLLIHKSKDKIGFNQKNVILSMQEILFVN